MNRHQFEGAWHQIKGKIKEKWGKLTDDDLTRIDGKYEQFVGKLQKKYGYTKEKAEQEIDHWHMNAANTSWGQHHDRGEEGERRAQKDPHRREEKNTWSHDSEKTKEWKNKDDGEYKDKKRKAG